MTESGPSGARKGARWGLAKSGFRKNRARIQRELDDEVPVVEIYRQMKDVLAGCSYQRFVRLVTVEFGDKHARQRRIEQRRARDDGASSRGAGAPAGGGGTEEGGRQAAGGGSGGVVPREDRRDGRSERGLPPIPRLRVPAADGVGPGKRAAVSEHDEVDPGILADAWKVTKRT